VSPQTSPAEIAIPAGQIDLADHPFPDKIPSIALDYFAHELVPRDSLVPVIPPLQLEIRTANPAAEKANERVTRGPAGYRRTPYLNLALVQEHCPHTDFVATPSVHTLNRY
jgi:hypothetical protein